MTENNQNNKEEKDNHFDKNQDDKSHQDNNRNIGARFNLQLLHFFSISLDTYQILMKLK
ncbi:MAG: hypothetical protein K6C94_08545 [Candidatus Gastranaerophilales bacterium]|nr:hypothetical protein [Candidatus Gastranaerophilales bacterium]